jgi:hypothetical protein
VPPHAVYQSTLTGIESVWPSASFTVTVADVGTPALAAAATVNVPAPVDVTMTFAFEESAVNGPLPRSGSAVTVSGVDVPGCSAMLARLDESARPAGFRSCRRAHSEPCYRRR